MLSVIVASPKERRLRWKPLLEEKGYYMGKWCTYRACTEMLFFSIRENVVCTVVYTYTPPVYMGMEYRAKYH